MRATTTQGREIDLEQDAFLALRAAAGPER